jgi:hypothetical protein
MNSEEEELRASTLQRITRQSDIMRRHYEDSGNPLFVWEAIRLFTSWGGATDPFPLPAWVTKYLCQTSSKLIDLAEGLDWSKAPADLLPPKGADNATILRHARRIEAWMMIQSADSKNTGKRALQILGLSHPSKKNVFADYQRALRQQDEAERFEALLDYEKLLRQVGRPARSRWGIIEEMAAKDDPSNKSKELNRAQSSLNRGRLQEKPLGRLWLNKHTRRR